MFLCCSKFIMFFVWNKILFTLFLLGMQFSNCEKHMENIQIFQMKKYSFHFMVRNKLAKHFNYLFCIFFRLLKVFLLWTSIIFCRCCWSCCFCCCGCDCGSWSSCCRCGCCAKEKNNFNFEKAFKIYQLMNLFNFLLI